MGVNYIQVWVFFLKVSVGAKIKVGQSFFAFLSIYLFM